MNNYEDWAQLVAKRLKGEADIITAIGKDELNDAAATDAFVRAVLEPFLPENFGVGSGRVVDAFGNHSDHLDVVIYNRDFPRIGIPGANSAYLYESVLATFSVRAKFIRKTFFESLDACASLAHLETNIDNAVLVKLAKKNGLKPGPNKQFLHEDPLRTARFELIGRPPAFVFGFSGIKNSYRQLQENIELWINHRIAAGIETPMKSLPAVIATQGCYAWRNAAPLALSNREMLGIGNDDAPIRLIVLQLLYLLNRRLNVTSDGYGLKPSLNAYLGQFAAPKFEIGIGDVGIISSLAKTDNAVDSEPAKQRFAPAMDRAPVIAAAADGALSQSQPAPPDAPATDTESAAIAESTPAEATAESPAQAAVFDKPSPFASAAIPESTPAEAAAESPAQAAVFDKPSPFASAPVPPPVEDPQPSRSTAPVAPLGSAPIPSMAKPASVTEPKPAAAKVIPPKPPVDFDLGAVDASLEDKPEPEEDEFTSTVVIPPNAGASDNKSTHNSTDAFITKVKQQLSSADPVSETRTDPFSATIPH